MIRFQVETRELDRLIAKVQREFRSEVVARTIGEHYLKWIDDNFRSGGSLAGWPSLSPNTRASRPGGPLNVTGSLRRSFRAIASSKDVSVESSHPLAEIHHEGTGSFTIRPNSARALSFMTTGGRVFSKQVDHPGIPERPLVPDEATALRLATETMEEWMAKIFGTAA